MAASNHQQSATSTRVELSLPDIRSRTAERALEAFKLMRQNRKRRRAIAKVVVGEMRRVMVLILR